VSLRLHPRPEITRICGRPARRPAGGARPRPDRREDTPAELKRRIYGAHIELHFAEPQALGIAAGLIPDSSPDADQLTLHIPGDGSVASLRRNLKQQLRYPSLTRMLAGFPIVFLLLFVYVFGGQLGSGLGGNAVPEGDRGAYLTYVVPASSS
jgi:hypothetical protein